MINVKVVKTVRGREIKVTETSLRRMMAVLPFIQFGKNKEEDVERSFAENAEMFLRDSCGLTPEDCLDLHPSEIEKIWEAFQEVNSFFFVTAKRLGVGEQLEETIRSVLSGVGGELANSFRTDIQAALTTDLAGLSQPPKPQEEFELEE